VVCCLSRRERAVPGGDSTTYAGNTASIVYDEAVGFVNEGCFTAADGDEKIAFSMALVE
jgi:hypothetical protein